MEFAELQLELRKIFLSLDRNYLIIGGTVVVVILSFIAYRIFFKKRAPTSFRKEKAKLKKKKNENKGEEITRVSNDKKKAKSLKPIKSDDPTSFQNKVHTQNAKRSLEPASKELSLVETSSDTEGEWITVNKNRKQSESSSPAADDTTRDIAADSRSRKIPNPPQIPPPKQNKAKVSQANTSAKKSSKTKKSRPPVNVDDRESTDESFPLSKPHGAATEEDTWHEVVSAKKKRQRPRKV